MFNANHSDAPWRERAHPDSQKLSPYPPGTGLHWWCGSGWGLRVSGQTGLRMLSLNGETFHCLQIQKEDAEHREPLTSVELKLWPSKNQGSAVPCNKSAESLGHQLDPKSGQENTFFFIIIILLFFVFFFTNCQALGNNWTYHALQKKCQQMAKLSIPIPQRKPIPKEAKPTSKINVRIWLYLAAAMQEFDFNKLTKNIWMKVK